MPPTDTRTGPLVAKLVEGVQADLSEAVEGLQKQLNLLRALESETKGVNGLSATLNAKAKALQVIVDDLAQESVAVAKKMLGTGPRPEITERRPDPETVAAITEAKEREAAEA